MTALAKTLTPADMDREIEALLEMDGAQLRDRWSLLTESATPKVRASTLQMALAWELQASLYGSLSGAARHSLRALSKSGHKSKGQQAQPGMRLAREWNGELHSVIVADDGAIIWNGQTWKSLSAVARAITGTRWSGPVFFGLRQKADA